MLRRGNGVALSILEVARSRVESERFWGRSTDPGHPWPTFPTSKIQSSTRGNETRLIRFAGVPSWPSSGLGSVPVSDPLELRVSPELVKITFQRDRRPEIWLEFQSPRQLIEGLRAVSRKAPVASEVVMQ